jgi:hypothetical protein
MDRYIDYKYTIWGRYYIPEEMTLEQAQELVKRQESGEGIWEELLKFDPEGREMIFERIDDTESPVSVNENDGLSTVEYWEEGKLLAQNGIGLK